MIAILGWLAIAVLLPLIWWKLKKRVGLQIKRQRDLSSGESYDLSWRQEELIWNLVTILFVFGEIIVILQLAYAISSFAE